MSTLLLDAMHSSRSFHDLLEVLQRKFEEQSLARLAFFDLLANCGTILLGKGDGTFTTATSSPATGKTPVGIVAGDFNGDGKLDLAVADEDSNSVTITKGGTTLLGATVLSASGTATPGSPSVTG